MFCDTCNAAVPLDTQIEVDATGRPVQLLCRLCHDVAVLERARRLGINSPVDLLDMFALHLSREIKPRSIH